MNDGCLRAMLRSGERVEGRSGPLRVYRCSRTGKVCVLSGSGPDKGLLRLACEDCPDGREGRGEAPPRV